MPTTTTVEGQNFVAIDDDILYGRGHNGYEDDDPWAVKGIVQRYCMGHDTIMGFQVRSHDNCEDVRVLTLYEAVRVLFDGPGVLGGLG